MLSSRLLCQISCFWDFEISQNWFNGKSERQKNYKISTPRSLNFTFWNFLEHSVILIFNLHVESSSVFQQKCLKSTYKWKKKNTKRYWCIHFLFLWCWILKAEYLFHYVLLYVYFLFRHVCGLREFSAFNQNLWSSS